MVVASSLLNAHSTNVSCSCASNAMASHGTYKKSIRTQKNCETQMSWQERKRKNKMRTTERETKERTLPQQNYHIRYLEELHPKHFNDARQNINYWNYILESQKDSSFQVLNPKHVVGPTSNKNKLEINVGQSSRKTLELIISHIDVDAKCYCSKKKLEWCQSEWKKLKLYIRFVFNSTTTVNHERSSFNGLKSWYIR